MTSEKTTVELIGEVIPNGYVTHSSVYAKISSFCKEIADIKKLSLAGQYVDARLLADKIEQSGGDEFGNIPWSIVDNLLCALSKALECYLTKSRLSS